MSGKADVALLEEVRERRILASNEWDAHSTESKKDRLCVAGRPWQALDPDAVRERKDAKRPMLALDELGQYLNQSVNDLRANPRGIKFAPTGNGANDKGAEFYQNHTREIEYRSHAREAYVTAAENAMIGGYGWLRITTKPEHVRTFNQDIWIEPIVNVDQVLPDPNAIWPDSRDMKYLFYLESWPIKDAEREFGKDIRGLGPEARSLASGWLKPDTIDLAEYWKLETFKRRLVAFRRKGKDPATNRRWAIEEALVDELPGGKLPDGADNVRESERDDTRVKAWLTNGIHILKEIPWKGKHIPFVSCFGKILYVDTGTGARRELMSMTRLARDPYMLHCYIATCKAEAIGGVPRASWVGYKGQFVNPTRWQEANHKPVAYLEVAVEVEGASVVLPHPVKQPWDPPIQNLEIAQESARRSIQAAFGVSPLPTDAQRHSQKSGVALRQIESSGQRGSFHFVDHYDLMIERVGVINEDLITPTLDTVRKVPVRLPNDKGDSVTINDPDDPDSVSTKGDYRVTVSTGPANDSQREAADQIVDALVGNLPALAPVLGPQKTLKVLAKSIKIKQLGPEGDELVELLDPPAPNGSDGKPVPPEVQAMHAQVQQLQQQLQQATQEIETGIAKERAKTEGQMAIEQMRIAAENERAALDRQAENHRAAMDRETKITVAELGAKVDRLQLFLEERERIGAAHLAVTEAVKDRIHERNVSEAAHQQALEQGQAGVDGQIAVQAAAPQPDAGAGAGA